MLSMRDNQAGKSNEEALQMIQDTSINAYHSINLSARQKQVYEVIKALGCPTNLEISTFTRIPINQITPRTNELVKMGIVVECEKRQCSISKRVAISWRIK